MPAKYDLGADKPKSGLRWLYLPFMLLRALASLALATQRIAAYFEKAIAQYDPSPEPILSISRIPTAQLHEIMAAFA